MINSNKVIKSPVHVVKDGFTVFLAGPMKGAPKWQRTVPKLAEEMGITGITFLNPYPCQRWGSASYWASTPTSAQRTICGTKPATMVSSIYTRRSKGV